MSKKAFLVGINNFLRQEWQLRGCINDSQAMQALLKTHFGFRDEGIKVIQDRDATADGIRAGLAWLLSEYDGHDVRVFHFASHGTQVLDDSGDELEVQDEVIVPYDHDWDKPFRDDELRAIFDAIPPGVNFSFLADCCHSGSIQRGILDSGVEFRPRYLDPPDAIKRALRAAAEQREAAADDAFAAELLAMLEDVPPSQRQARAKTLVGLLRKTFRENKFAAVPAEKHFLLAACEDRQTAADARLDGDFHGAFSWALCKAIDEAGANQTYQDLIARIGAYLADFDQRPQLECPACLGATLLFEPLA